MQIGGSYVDFARWLIEFDWQQSELEAQLGKLRAPYGDFPPRLCVLSGNFASLTRLLLILSGYIAVLHRRFTT